VKGKVIPFWVIPILLGLAIATVWIRLSIVRTSYEIDLAEKMQKNLMEEREKLRFQITRLRSPETLDAIARQKYHLAPPAVRQVVRFRDDE